MFFFRSVISSEIEGELKSTADTPQIVDCKAMRPFWISWKGGLIEAGRGMVVGREGFVSFQNNQDFIRPVHWVSVTTGYGSDGNWELFTVKRKIS